MLQDKQQKAREDGHKLKDERGTAAQVNGMNEILLLPAGAALGVQD